MNKPTLKRYIETTIQKQEDWLRAAFLEELGTEFHGKSDEIIAEEAKKRGYKVIYNSSISTHELKNKEKMVIGTFNINLRSGKNEKR
jgi:hypothetical protein